MEIILQGLFIGNGWPDPVDMLKYDNYLYELGLIDFNAKVEFSNAQRLAVDLIEKEKCEEAADAINQIVGGSGGSTGGGLWGPPKRLDFFMRIILQRTTGYYLCLSIDRKRAEIHAVGYE
ncbi:hypothetical protein LSTR_LSTR005517 [Laodelphax striatellus]|uniref:Uncharacterized protein n=1 Tax=Laodelphax striatellus TaxID=195883 RepID=A0A482WXY5_LAOST|nr:hypothetical protein LSTR_LSTR005517 [Laodelphax striatellus]